MVTRTPAEFALAFGDPNNRIGMSVPSGDPILDVADGAEDFRLGVAEPFVPEPACMVMLMLGTATLVLRRRRKTA